MSEKLGSFLILRRDGSAYIVGFTQPKIVEEEVIEEIGRQLGDLVDADPGLRLLLDFSGVEHLSSGALGMLVTLYKETLRRNGRLRISSISPQILEVFNITRLNKFFEVFDSTEAALLDFAKS